ncbi:MAG: AI-2E family transporter [Ruminococcus sp.]|uniref:AI-2E family transporter n=1 Tax=Ruminococcus sp. TaxID=41978 RepID=UPI0028737263|nr:AI-2E family transporter [Ruminococcus sp.]MBQ3285870.1 AI-2E family transporter [Ruminococcus sp.]
MKRFSKLVENRKIVYTLAAMAGGILCAALVCYLILANLGSFAGLFSTIAKVLAPLIIGLVLAYIIDPVAKFFENKVFVKMKKEKLRRTISSVVALVLVFALLAVFIGMLIPSLISSISMLIANADTYYATVETVVEKINSLGFGVRIDLLAIETSIRNWLGNLVNSLSKDLSSVLTATKDIGASVITIVIGVILAIYILFSKEYMVKGLRRLRKALYTPKKYESSTKFWKRCDDIFTQYIGCNVIDALIIGISNAIFMLILGMPYVPLVSFVVGVCNLIPTFGPIIGAVIGALVLVLVKPAFALWFLIFTIGIQILDAYVIKPRLFSSSFGMAPVWTLISITVGGNLFGIVGVLLAIPVAAILSFIYDEKFIPWLQRKSEARARRAAELAEEEAAAAAPGEFAASQESAESDIKTAEE